MRPKGPVFVMPSRSLRTEAERAALETTIRAMVDFDLYGGEVSIVDRSPRLTR